MKSFKICF